MPASVQMLRKAAPISAALILATALGCGGDPCSGAEDRAVPLSELPCSMMGANGMWESHPLPPIADEACYWLEFRACSRYRFENPLSQTPTTVIGYTSFDADGTFSTVGSGNSFIVEEATDSEVTIRNAQNQLFWLRLVLE
jgi:hypothetical protein